MKVCGHWFRHNSLSKNNSCISSIGLPKEFKAATKLESCLVSGGGKKNWNQTQAPKSSKSPM